MSAADRDVRMRGFRQRTEVGAVIELIRARVHRLGWEKVPVRQAAGRLLAEACVAPMPLPPFDRAAMDGFAVRGEETTGASPYQPLEFVIVGESRPGRSFAGHVGPGQAVRIMTGAPMPLGADTVVPAEYTEVAGPVVRVTEGFAPGRHVSCRGEDVAQGEVLLPSRRVLRPQDVAVLAAAGIAEVPVVVQPRVRILITGDELLPPGSVPHDAFIVDSNSVMLEALVRRDGGVPLTGAIVPDRPEAIRHALLEDNADMLLVSGGSSVGPEDHAPLVLAELGELVVHGVAMRPSSPAGLGWLGHKPVFLLPGNPVSCLAAYDFFAGLALRRMAGLQEHWPYPCRKRILAQKIVSAIGRVDYVRVQVRPEGVVPLAVSGASLLSTTTRADGFVVVPRDREGYAPGESVEVYHFDLFAVDSDQVSVYDKLTSAC